MNAEKPQKSTSRDGRPRWPDKLLMWLVAPHLREEVLGDIHERYLRRAERLGIHNARRRYWREVLAYVRPAFIKRHPSRYPTTLLISPDMLQNYIKIAWRNLVKNKAYSFINIIGLSLGMTCSLLISLWVIDEFSFNKGYKNVLGN